MHKSFFYLVLSSCFTSVCFAQNPDERLVGAIDSEYKGSIFVPQRLSEAEFPDTIFGHCYVDLGLPSGLIWAQYNIAASGADWNPVGKVFNYDNLRGKDIEQLHGMWVLNDADNLTLGYDDAHWLWGHPWHLPTLDDFQELADNTTSRAAKRGGQYGFVFTSIHNGKEIFFPAPHREMPDGGLAFTAYYMSSTPYKGDVADAEWSGLYITYELPVNAERGDACMDFWIPLEDGVLIRPVYDLDTADYSDVFTDILIEDDEPEEMIGEVFTELCIVDDEPEEEETVFVHVEEQPEFPGGQPVLFKWIAEHIVYPPSALENNITGRVVVQFVITKEGNIGEVQLLLSKNPELDAEAIRVVKSLPKFRPGMQEGIPVNSWYTIPVLFKLPISE